MDLDLKGRVALVTGSSQGIGKAAAVKVADAGATVLLVARSVDKLEETKAEIEAAHDLRRGKHARQIRNSAGCSRRREPLRQPGRDCELRSRRKAKVQLPLA